MTQNEELRALAEKARDHNREGMSVTEALVVCASLGAEHNRILAVLDANAALVAALRDLAVHAENMEAQNADYHGPEGVVRSAPLNAAYVALALAESAP